MLRPPHHPIAGRYALVDLIGAGAMGSVWRGYDVREQCWVAVKLLRGAAGTPDNELLLRFVREQGVRIRHPHVLAPRSWAAEDDAVCLVMDLVRGGSVHQLLGEHGPFPSAYVAGVLDQLFDALIAVHAAGVVHRDIKPANLLLDPGPRLHLRLADFGVAAGVDSLRFTEAPGLIGTSGYAAPEQEAGAAPDPSQDLYAAGRVAIQLLTGVGPQRQDGVPAGPLHPLLTALVAPDPDDRPPSAVEARRLLRLAVPDLDDVRGPVVPDRLGDASVPVAAALGLPAARAGSAGRRTPASLWAAMGCFASALCLCGVAWTRLLG